MNMFHANAIKILLLNITHDGTSKLYGVNATIIIFVFVFYCIV